MREAVAPRPSQAPDRLGPARLVAQDNAATSGGGKFRPDFRDDFRTRIAADEHFIAVDFIVARTDQRIRARTMRAIAINADRGQLHGNADALREPDKPESLSGRRAESPGPPWGVAKDLCHA